MVGLCVGLCVGLLVVVVVVLLVVVVGLLMGKLNLQGEYYVPVLQTEVIVRLALKTH